MFRKALDTLAGGTGFARACGGRRSGSGAMRLLAHLGAALLICTALAAPAAAQVMTINGASPSSYAGPGETITFVFTYGQSNAITNSVSLNGTSIPISSFNCVGLPLAPNATTTCTGTYTTTASDAFGVLLFGQFTAVDGNGTPRSGNISNRYVVPIGSTPPQAQAFTLVSSVAENSGSPLRFQVGLNKYATTPVTINYSFGGTATAGSDYAPAGGSVTLPLGAINWEVTVNPIGDSTHEPDETVVLNIASGSGYTIGSPSSATGTISNDDTVPLPNLTINDVAVPEGNAGTGIATFTVSLDSPAPAGGVSFDIATANGSATAGNDYVARSLTGQTIPAGSSSYSFNVQVNGDTVHEPDENFLVNIGNISGAIVADGQGVATIINDDAQPQANVSVAPASVAEDGAANLVFTVSLTGTSSTATTVNYQMQGTATPGVDFATVGSSVTIPAGAGSATVVVDPTADTAFEADETVVLGLATGIGYELGAAQMASATILNDDASPQTITFNNPGAQNFGTSPTLTATSSSNLTVTFGSSTTTVCTITTGGTLTFVNAGTCTIDADQAGNATYAPAATVSRSFTVNPVVPGAPIIGTATAGNAQAMVSFTAPASNGGVAITGYTVTSSPGGFTSTGAGSPVIVTGLSNGTAYTFTVTATNTAGTGAASMASNSVVPVAPVVVSPASLPAAAVGTAYSQTITASGGIAPHSHAVTAGALPAGMALDSAGTLSGTPTAGGSFNFTVTATDSAGAPGPYTGSRAYTLSVAAPSVIVSPTSLADGMVGSAYNQMVSASGGTAPHSHAITAGTLPTGLSLSTSGLLSGTPSTNGNFNFTVTATDSSTGSGPYSGSRAYSVTITHAVPVAANSSASIAYDTAGVIALDIIGVVDSITVTGAPTHGTLSLAGTTPTYTPGSGYAGTDSFTYTATNDGGTSAPATVSIAVGAPVIDVTAGNGLAANVGLPYSQTFSWNGGSAPFTGYQVSGLPAGLSITANSPNSATVSGTPTEAGSFSLVASAMDSSSGDGPFTGTGAFTLVVAAPSLALAPAASTFNADYDNAFSQAFAASGGIGPYAYAVSGALPAGVSFSGDTLSGTPVAPGSYPITVTASDTGSTGAGAPFTISENYTLVVAAPTIVLDPSALADGAAGQPYAGTFTASGGVAPYGFAVTSGTLPAGLSLANDGTMSGTPTEAGTFNMIVTATDANGQAGSQAYALDVSAPSLALSPAGGNFATDYNAAWTQTFVASGGVGGYTYALNGALPSGVSFSGDTLSGTPTEPGSFTITVTATDTGSTGAGAPFTVSQGYTLVVGAATIVLDPAALSAGTAGQAYAANLAATGGVAPYAFAIATGQLPTGLSLAGDGSLSGIPTESGDFDFTVVATDSHGQSGSQAYSLNIAVPALDVSPATLDAVVAGADLHQVLSISGGIAPYTVTLSGTLPQGVRFDPATRTFSGRPLESGSFALTIGVTDSTEGNAATLTREFSLTVQAPSLEMTPVAGALPAATGGVAYTQTFVTEGGIAPYAYALASGTLPAGLSLDAEGRLSGMPTEAGAFEFSVTSTDSTEGTAGSLTQAYTLAVDAPSISVSPGELPAATFGTEYEATLVADGGTAPYRFAITDGSLPAGLVLAADGMLSGAPTESGVFELEITATDALGFTGARRYSLQAIERPDPSQDPEVRGLVDAQLQSARRFARAQVDNFQQRLERLHGGRRGAGVDSAVSVVSHRTCMQPPGTDPSAPCVLPAPSPDAMAASADSTTLGAQENPRGFGAWIGGSIRSGGFDGMGGSSVGFESDGISIGFDYDLGPAFTLGAGLGHGRDQNDVGDIGSRIDGRANTLVGYASYHPGQHFFIDGLVGYQTLDFDLRRELTAVDGSVRGQRDGDQWFGSLSLGTDLQSGALQFTPYARFDLTRGSLDGYTENGHPIMALRYEAMDVDSATGNLGLRLDYRHRITPGWLMPQFRIEYQRELEGSSDALVRYADLASGPFYTLTPSAFDRSRFMFGLGLGYEGDSGWSTRVEYRSEAGTDDQRDEGVLINLQKDY